MSCHFYFPVFMFFHICKYKYPSILYFAQTYVCICMHLCRCICTREYLFVGILCCGSRCFTCKGLPEVLSISLLDLLPAAVVSSPAAVLLVFLSDGDDLRHRHAVTQTWTHTARQLPARRTPSVMHQAAAYRQEPKPVVPRRRGSPSKSEDNKIIKLSFFTLHIF